MPTTRSSAATSSSICTWTADELAQVADATAPPRLYPHWMLEMFKCK